MSFGGLLYEVHPEYDENGWIHNTDGPAMVIDNTVYWAIHGGYVKFDLWCEMLDKSEKEKALLLLKWTGYEFFDKEAEYET